MRWLAFAAFAGLAAAPAAAWGGVQGDGWVSAIPDQPPPLGSAVIIGHETGMPLYACRGSIEGGIHVGRYRHDFAGCHIGYNGREADVAPFQLLTTSWLAAAKGQVPDDALPVGGQLATDSLSAFAVSPLYSCVAAYQGGLHPGQLEAGGNCEFGFGGHEMVQTSYLVLRAASWMSWAIGTARDLPDTAIIGGNEGGEPFYICRAADATGLHPGKIKASSLGCSIASAGREVVAEHFQILVPRWVAQSGGLVPVGGIPSGRDNGSLLFVCRAQSRNTVQVGKVDASLGGCHVGMQGRETVFQDYEVLAQ